MIGIVKEVFIPEEYNGNTLLDTMNSDKIGFKVEVYDKEITIIEKQNNYNANIHKNDKVRIVEDLSTDRYIISLL